MLQHGSQYHLTPTACRSKIPNYKDDSEEADAIKRTFRDIIQDYAKDTSYLASFVPLTPGVPAVLYHGLHRQLYAHARSAVS